MIGTHLRELDLNLLVVLQALIEEKSVTRAAARLGVTQPAVSRSLARLRVVFDDPLFVRAGASLQPTTRTESVSAPLAQLLSDLESRVLAPERFDPGNSDRSFTIAAADYSELPLLPRLAAHLGAHAPRVRLRVIAAARDVASMVEEADLAIGPRSKEGSLRSRRLFVDPFVCIVRRDHPLEALDLERFVRMQHLLIAPRQTPGGVVDDALAALGHTRTVAMQVQGFQVAPAIVAASDLVCTLPRSVALRGAELYPIRLLPPPLVLPDIRMHLCWHPRWQHDPGHIWLRDLVCEILAD